MGRFYIKEISASGENVKFSSISFHDGMNIIYGPSNTGKSYIIGCINFILGGSDIPFTKADTGYDTISAKLEMIGGGSLFLTRKIVDGKKGETGEGKVTVQSTVSGISSGDYGLNNYRFNNLLLYLMGIREEHKIIATKDYKPERLTFRSMFHLFYLEEESIFRKTTVLDFPRGQRINASMSIIRFLLTGDDLMDTIPKETAEEHNRKITERTGVLAYLNQKIDGLVKRKKELQQQADGLSIEDAEQKLSETLRQADEIEAKIVKTTERSRILLKQIYQVSAQLEETQFAGERYHALESQYSSDLKRLEFIIDGKLKEKKIVPPSNCPYCGQALENVPSVEENYIETAEIEYNKIKLRLSDLQAAITQLAADGVLDPETYQNELNQLNKEKMDLSAKKTTLTMSLTNNYLYTAEAGKLARFLKKASITKNMDEEAFREFVDGVIVYSRTLIGFKLKCGLLLKEELS
jgi:hypothetical protein